MKKIVLWMLAAVFGLWFALYMFISGSDGKRYLGTLTVPQVPGLRLVLEQDQEFEHVNGVYYRVIGPRSQLLYGPFALFGSEDWIDDASAFRVASYDSVLVLTYDSPHQVVALYDVRTRAGYPGGTLNEAWEDEYRRRDELLCRVQAHNPQLSWADFMR